MKSNSTQYKYLAAVAVVGLLLVAIGFGTFSQEEKTYPIASSLTIPQVDFQFDVYCPITNANELKIINNALGYSTKVLSFDFKVHNNVYVVIAKAQASNPDDPSSQGKVYYCGLTRKWADKNCNNAVLQCSIPGPMFYLPVQQEATIIFFNTVNSSEVNWIKTDCYADDSDDQFCKVTAKEIKKGCSYPDPTDYSGWATGKHRVNSKSIPISPHIHGLQTRPTFDGNPLGWFNPDGQTGPGFNSLLNSEYYELFNDPAEVKSWLVIPEALIKLTKVIKAPNVQIPGMLFYHDHAMRSTLYNVQNGFSGLYIIYDQKVEQNLPQGNFQKFVLFAKPGDARLFVSPSSIEGQNDVIEEGTYRIRMINAHFDNVYINVSYCAYYEAVTDESGKTIYIEYDPTTSPQGTNVSIQADLSAYRHHIPFSVIGTDTTIFHQSIDDIDQVTMGPAERVDILINFQASLPAGIEYVYIICYDNNAGKLVMKHRFVLPWDSSNLKTDEKIMKSSLNSMGAITQQNIEQISDINENEDKVVALKEKESYLTDPDFRKNVIIEVPFTDLSLVPDEKIAVKRHRPLFSLPFDTKFMIGAHYMFEMGRADNPQIGTIDDFYLVNTLWEAHPMHIHLINFQVVATYSLKSIPENEQCTLYMLDYFRLSGLPEVQLQNVELCNYLWGLDSSQVDSLFEKLGDYSLENVTINRNSGLDTMTPYDGDSRYLVEGCEWNTLYKYVCGNTTTTIPEYTKRWKDTFMVPAYSVAIMRVRWASTGYEPEKKPYPYFGIPEDQLVEFPGFVYHCHILPHEDNQMMRPFVLRYSEEYLRRFDEFKRKGSCTGRSWFDTLGCINSKLGCSS